MELLAARAQLVLDDLCDPDLTLSIVKRAETDAAEDARISALLESFYARLGDWDSVFETLRCRGFHLSTDDDRAAAQVALAVVYEERVQDGDQAIQHYERAIELRPGDTAKFTTSLNVNTEVCAVRHGCARLTRSRSGRRLT